MDKNKIISAIILHFKSRKNAAKALGISESTFSRNLEKLTPDFIERLISIGVPIDTPKEPKDSVEVVNVLGSWIPVIKSVNAGDPKMIYRQENIQEKMFVSGWTKQEGCYCLRVIGDSMISNNGKSINENDVVIVDIHQPIYPGDIVVVSLQSGREMVKQFIPGDNGKTILHSFNPNNPDIVVNATDIIVMHRVMGIIPPIKRL